MKTRSRPLFVLSLALGLCLGTGAGRAEDAMMKSASTVKAVTHFVSPQAFDYPKLLAAPPAPDTLAGQAEVEAVLQAQIWRTPEQTAWAQRIAKANVSLNADVLGSWFTPQNLPLTFALFKELSEDMHEVGEASKQLFARARPYIVDTRIVPCVDKPTNDSYPSGHTMHIFMRAGVLAEIFPARRAELFELAHRAAWGRVFGGVHFPSDLVGGWTLAEAFVVTLKKNAAFQARLEACRAEMAPFTALKKAA